MRIYFTKKTIQVNENSVPDFISTRCFSHHKIQQLFQGKML